ncbi:cytochrome c(L), periplasmic [Methylocaldum szegediense]|mgnify:CR=1 FL=1|uniref:Cytochrome c-L n=1 Tax=Methylocaldum szegediense TaxID=73780 RepID=A0ABM9HX55_9GAMM|nr:cytochrome c(L), periplasmic [Methylocaldum szegediense]CAI8745834.1 cytochrome c-L [Methylocaldum szegediense]
MKLKTCMAAFAVGAAFFSVAAYAEVTFRHAITGEVLDLNGGKAGGDTDAVKQFKETGKNPYNGDKEAIEKGHSLFLTACSGCHGHEAEGKLGPGLGDDYWTYPRAATDVGLFEVLWGGAQGMMGPQNNNLNADEMLQIMAWIRSIYKGDPAKAEWLK